MVLLGRDDSLPVAAGCLGPAIGWIAGTSIAYGGMGDRPGVGAHLEQLLIAGATQLMLVAGSRALATKSVVGLALIGSMVSLAGISLLALMVAEEDMAESLLFLAALWGGGVGGTFVGHTAGNLIAKRLESRLGPRRSASARRAAQGRTRDDIVDAVETATAGWGSWRPERVVRTYPDDAAGAARLASETALFAERGYVRGSVTRTQQGSGSDDPVGVVLDAALAPSAIEVTFQRSPKR